MSTSIQIDPKAVVQISRDIEHTLQRMRTVRGRLERCDAAVASQTRGDVHQHLVSLRDQAVQNLGAVIDSTQRLADQLAQDAALVEKMRDEFRAGSQP